MKPLPILKLCFFVLGLNLAVDSGLAKVMVVVICRGIDPWDGNGWTPVKPDDRFEAREGALLAYLLTKVFQILNK